MEGRNVTSKDEYTNVHLDRGLLLEYADWLVSRVGFSHAGKKNVITTEKISALTLFHISQQGITAAQLVLRYHTIRRFNNYAVLQSIPFSPECKIVGQILLDHPLSYALTATADVSVVYLQQF
ncbi:hypothetical protein Tco_0299179 [Tanacetum coccineum]